MNGEVKERKRSGRYVTKTRNGKNMMTELFYGPDVVNFSHLFSVLSFTQVTNFRLKTIILKNLSKFYAFVLFFQILVNFFLQTPN